MSLCGEAIADWKRVTLSSLSAFITKGTTPTTYGFKWESSGILFLRSECVSDHGLDLTQSMFISAAAHNALHRSQILPDDLLVTITGNVGRVVMFEGADIANMNQHIARVRIVDPQAHPRFIYHWLSQDTVRRHFVSITTGQAYPQISLVQVRNVEVPLPPIDQQTAIASALSDTDALLAGLDRLIAKKRGLKQAAMQQLLTGQVRLPGFQGEWEVKPLGDVATFHKGRGLPKSSLIPYGAEPCIHYGELFTRYQETIETICSRTDDGNGAFRSAKYDVLMPTSDVTPRGLAKASCVQVDGVILGGDILVIRCNRKLVFGSFLSYTIRHQEEQILQLVTGTTVFHLYRRDMAKLTLSLPSVEEQIAIVRALTDMAAELTALEARRDKTFALKRGMMQELLTGRTRLV